MKLDESFILFMIFIVYLTLTEFTPRFYSQLKWIDKVLGLGFNGTEMCGSGAHGIVVD